MSGLESKSYRVSKIYFLQALRAIAAWLVVSDHALMLTTGNSPSSKITSVAWALGDIGVFAFFVISGFIMVTIGWSEFAIPGSSSKFLRRRVLRIVPFYWTATLAALGFHLVSGSEGLKGFEVIRSFFFIPAVNAAGRFAPVLPQGWSLSYEMMFYGLFACALMLKRQIAIPMLIGTLLAMVWIGPTLPSTLLATLAAPCILWFVLGIGLGYVWCRLQLVEPAWLARASMPLEFFGDASYSTYLVHGTAIALVGKICMHFLGHVALEVVPIVFVLATGAGCLVHVAVEKPLIAAMKRHGKKAKAHSSGPQAILPVSATPTNTI
jgi:exopolysaccharide production protein ExoZ